MNRARCEELDVAERLRVSLFFGCAGAALALSACGPTPGSRPSLRQQVDADLAAVSAYDPPGAAEIDRQYDGAFTKIFGGRRGADVRRYLDERVQYFATPDEPVRVEPSFSSVFGSSERFSRMRADRDGTLAANAGFLIWLAGVASELTPTVHVAGKSIRLASSRPGFVQVGEDYKLERIAPTSLGIETPMAVRASVLLHEARHSDCPRGLDGSVRGLVRGALSSTEVFALMAGKQCGQLHTPCMSGPLAGVPQCDNNPFGPTVIEIVYLKGALPSLDGVAKRMVEAQIADRIYRASKGSAYVNVEKALRGEYGAPEMTAPPAAAAERLQPNRPGA